VQFAGQLLKYLKDSDEDVVLRAIEAIGLIGGDQELFHLFSFLNHSRDRLRKCAHSTLQILGKDRLQNLLDKMSRLPKKEARRLAIQSIRLLSFVQGVPVLKRLLTDREELVSQMAAETLRAFGHLSEPDEVPVTEEEQGDPGTDFIRISDSIKKAGDPALISSLLVSLAESDGSGEEKLRIYMSFLNHEDDRVRANALEYMAPYIPEDRLDFYIGYFADPNNRIRGNAILALARNRKLFREHESYVNNAIESLVKDSRPFYKLTALYCIGILHHPGHLNMVTELQECSIAAVSAKAEELLNSWEKINPGLISQARSAHSMIKARPEAAFLPEKMEEKRKFIQKSLTDPSPEVRMEFLNKLCELEPDPSLSSIVLPFFSQERLPQALGLFIDALHHHGLEDRWYHFKGYLKSNDSRILLSAYKALVDVEGFPVMTQLETFIHSANLSEGRNAEILAVCLPRLVVQNRQIALKTMQRLSEGNEKCLRFFAESLYLFKDPPPVLHRHAIEVLSGAIEVPTLEKCGEYLLKNLDTDTLTGRVKNLIQKSRYAQQKEFLENLLDKIAEKKASMRRI
jgi:HEAT repeat protein